jgi:regulator of replication initiation timing
MQDSLDAEYSSMVKENNKLKLENAALRAENHLLKRYLNYFENLFARRNCPQSKVEEC